MKKLGNLYIHIFTMTHIQAFTGVDYNSCYKMFVSDLKWIHFKCKEKNESLNKTFSSGD